MRGRLLAVSSLLLAAACATVLHNTTSPEATLRRLRSAVRDRDLAAFERQADLHALAGQLDAAMPRDLPELRARNVSIDIPAGTFAPQFLRQLEEWVRHGKRPSPGLAPIVDTIEDGEIVAQRDNGDGSRTVTLRGSSDDVHLVMRRDGVTWRITGFEDLRIPLPLQGSAAP